MNVCYYTLEVWCMQAQRRVRTQSSCSRLGSAEKRKEKKHLSAELCTSYYIITGCQMNVTLVLFLSTQDGSSQRPMKSLRFSEGCYLFRQEMLENWFMWNTSGSTWKSCESQPGPQTKKGKEKASFPQHETVCCCWRWGGVWCGQESGGGGSWNRYYFSVL